MGGDPGPVGRLVRGRRRRHEPREVTLGAKTESGYVVLSGLAAGEKVVVAANFLIDSESSLRAAVEAMKAPSGTQKP